MKLSNTQPIKGFFTKMISVLLSMLSFVFPNASKAVGPVPTVHSDIVPMSASESIKTEGQPAIAESPLKDKTHYTAFESGSELSPTIVTSSPDCLNVDSEINKETTIVISVHGDDAKSEVLPRGEINYKRVNEMLLRTYDNDPSNTCVIRVLAGGQTDVIKAALSEDAHTPETSESAPKYRSFAQEKLHKKTDTVVELVRQMVAKGADPSRIVLSGHSFGGWVAMRAALVLAQAQNNSIKVGSLFVTAPACSQKFQDDKIEALKNAKTDSGEARFSDKTIEKLTQIARQSTNAQAQVLEDELKYFEDNKALFPKNSIVFVIEGDKEVLAIDVRKNFTNAKLICPDNSSNQILQFYQFKDSDLKGDVGHSAVYNPAFGDYLETKGIINSLTNAENSNPDAKVKP